MVNWRNSLLRTYPILIPQSQFQNINYTHTLSNEAMNSSFATQSFDEFSTNIQFTNNRNPHILEIAFSNFSSMFLNPYIFSNLNYNCSNLFDERNLQEQV